MNRRNETSGFNLYGPAVKCREFEFEKFTGSFDGKIEVVGKEINGFNG
jgi:hypothetical protein